VIFKTFLPRMRYIPETEESEKLYRAEHRRTESIMNSAKALAKYLGCDATEIFDEALPESLLSALDSFQTSVSIAVAVAFLRNCGLVVPDQVCDNELTVPYVKTDNPVRRRIEIADGAVTTNTYSVSPEPQTNPHSDLPQL
jgi:hypothetical protein